MSHPKSCLPCPSAMTQLLPEVQHTQPVLIPTYSSHRFQNTIKY